MSEIDDQVAAMMRAAALAHEPALIEETYSPVAYVVKVHDGRKGGISIMAIGRRKAWTLALEAAQRRTAWRVRLAERKIERARAAILDAKANAYPIPGDAPYDDGPDGAA